MRLAKHLAWTWLLGILIISLTGCERRSEKPPPPKPVTLTVATFTKAIAHAPLYAALHFKWFEGEPDLKGVTINYTVYNDRPTISQAFGKAELHVLFSAEAPQILGRAQGDDIRIVMLTTWAAQEILVQNELPVRSFKDLKGKTLALLAGTSSHYGILKLLEANKMTQSDIVLKFMSPPEAKTAFETKQIDSWAAWAPWVEQQTVAGRGKVLPGGAEPVNEMRHSPLEDYCTKSSIT
jgi:sulfonate transport system substrate-binding protein